MDLVVDSLVLAQRIASDAACAGRICGTVDRTAQIDAVRIGADVDGRGQVCGGKCGGHPRLQLQLIKLGPCLPLRLLGLLVYDGSIMLGVVPSTFQGLLGAAR